MEFAGHWLFPLSGFFKRATFDSCRTSRSMVANILQLSGEALVSSADLPALHSAFDFGGFGNGAVLWQQRLDQSRTDGHPRNG